MIRPTRRRTACGMIIPMNPIIPLNDTTAPVISAESRKMDSLGSFRVDS